MLGSIRKLHIEAPEYNLGKNIQDNASVPVVKYIVIYNSYKQPKTYHYHIRKRLSRHYSIGILTERNEYYHSYIGYNKLEMNKRFIQYMKTIFLTRYRYTKNTKILIYDDIQRKIGPFMSFLDIMASCHNIKIQKVSEAQMFRTICKYYKMYGSYGRRRYYHKIKIHKIKTTSYAELSRRMFEKKIFEFITDPDWEHKLELKPDTERISELRCAQGIIYLHICTLNSGYIKKWKENKKKKEEDQNKQV